MFGFVADRFDFRAPASSCCHAFSGQRTGRVVNSRNRFVCSFPHHNDCLSFAFCCLFVVRACLISYLIYTPTVVLSFFPSSLLSVFLSSFFPSFQRQKKQRMSRAFLVLKCRNPAHPGL